LGNAPPETGLPIGNLTSQFFGNVYFNGLDQFIKHSLKVRHYVRYVDDFVLLANDVPSLQRWHAAIAEYLRNTLRLTLRPDARIAPIANGIDFLGYIVRPGYSLVRRRVISHLREKLQAAHRQITSTPGQWQFAPALRESLLATLASYRGHFSHAKVGGLYTRLIHAFPWLTLFGWGRDARAPAKPHAFYIRRPRSLSEQIQAVRASFPDAICDISVGNVVLRFAPATSGRKQAARSRELGQVARRLRSPCRPKAALPTLQVSRAQRLAHAGPPKTSAPNSAQSAPWVSVAQGGRLHPRLRARFVVAMSVPAKVDGWQTVGRVAARKPAAISNAADAADGLVDAARSVGTPCPPDASNINGFCGVTIAAATARSTAPLATPERLVANSPFGTPDPTIPHPNTPYPRPLVPVSPTNVSMARWRYGGQGEHPTAPTTPTTAQGEGNARPPSSRYRRTRPI